VRTSAKATLFLLVTAAVVALLVLTIARDRRSEPYRIRRSDLTGWRLISSHGSEPWVVALQPSAQLAESLTRQVTDKTGPSFHPPTRAALPLVLRTEYADSLQGERDVDLIVNMAAADGIERSRFQPTCIGRRRDPSGNSSAELLFVAFDAPGFWQLRTSLIPDHQEIAGNGVYDPAALSPILPIASSDEDFERWLPLRVDPLADCQAPLVIE
jgi:hypothetical protein